MPCLKINDDQGETVGVIPLYCETSTLQLLREEIEDDFEVRHFLFKQDGKNLHPSEELNTIVASAAHEMVDDAGKQFFVVIISRNDEEYALESTSKCNLTDFQVTSPEPAREPEATALTVETNRHSNNQCSSSTKSSVSFLRSPTSWEIRGVKIYTQYEIGKAKGMEKKRREFWNKEAKRLCQETKMSRNDVCKEINVAWRKHQATLLLEEESLLEGLQNDSEAVDFNKCSTPNNCKPGTIQKNLDRIRQHKNELDQVFAEIESTECGSEIGRKRKLDELNDKKSFLLVELKKAQDAMRKNLKKNINFVRDLSDK